MSVLRFEDVTYRYPHATQAALRGVSVDVASEQLTAVMRAEFARMGELIRAANIRE